MIIKEKNKVLLASRISFSLLLVGTTLAQPTTALALGESSTARELCETDTEEDTSESTGDIVGIAESLVGKFKDKYQLGGFDRAIKNYGKNGSIPQSADDVDDSKVIDCSTFVSLVLTMAGVKGVDPAPSSGAMASDAKGAHKNFKEVSKENAKAGDIAASSTHVLFLAEDWHGEDTEVISMGDNKGVVKGKFSTYKGESNDITFAEPVGIGKSSSSPSKSSSSLKPGSIDEAWSNGVPYFKMKWSEPKGYQARAKKIAKEVGKTLGIDPGIIYGQMNAEFGVAGKSESDLAGMKSIAEYRDWTAILAGNPGGEKYGGVVQEDGTSDGHFVKFEDDAQFANAYATILGHMLGGSVSETKKIGKDVSKYVSHLQAGNYFGGGSASAYQANIESGLAKYYGAEDISSSLGTVETEEDTSNDENGCAKEDSDKQVSGTWDWPFPDVGEGTFAGGQLFGVHPGGEFRQNGFHDGLDFGSSDHPGSEVHAVHGGKVVKIDYAGGLEWYVVTKGDDNLSIVYQEFATQRSNIKVEVGDTVDTGDVIGIRDTEHLHLGITTKDFDEAVSHSFDASGGWLDPQQTIKEGIENGGSDNGGKGGKSTLKLSKKEEEARQFIVQHESGGNYQARNPSNPNVYGAYQLTLDKLGGDLSPAHQDKVADQYAKSRYGGWVEALNFWKANRWW